VAFQTSGYGASTDEVASTMQASQANRSNQLYDCIDPVMRLRRLTEIECERLQGFPDNWTRVPYNGKSASRCPSGVRYKALGNSMAVNVMRWLGMRIAMVDEIPD